MLRNKDSDKRRHEGPAAIAREASVISSDMRITGDCTTDGHVRVLGKITGKLVAHDVEVTSSGSVQGDLVAPSKSDGNEVFVVDGEVAGAVRANRVEVRRNGAVSGGIEADDAVIGGRVLGGILARNRLSLNQTAAVDGDVRARRLALEEGGQVNGTIHMGEHIEAMSAAASANGRAGKKGVAKAADEDAKIVLAAVADA